MKLSLLCKKCNGKCCKPPIFLGYSDIKKLKKTGKIFEYKKNKTGGYDLISKDKCPFLKEGLGCTLEKKLKPFDCLLFPLAFKENKEKFIFYLNKICPCWKTLPHYWIVQTKRVANRKLKDWTVKERDAYCERQKNFLGTRV